MGMTRDWTLNEYVAVFVPNTPGSTYNIDQPAVVQFVAGINGWAYSVFQSGVTLVESASAYGEGTG